MKRFFALAALLLGLAACQTEPEGLDVNVGGAVDTTITVAIPEGTRASSADGFDLSDLANTDYSLRYILEIYRVDDSNGTCQRHVLVSDNKSVAFPVRLVPGYNYNVVVWADIVEGNSEADRYYKTTDGLDAITIIENNEIKWNAMDETRDAYTATATFNNFQVSQLNTPISLTRPFAKLRVVATDIEDIRKVGLEPTTATVAYSQEMYRTFDARTGVASGAASKSHTISYATPAYEDATGEYTLFADYFFVPSTGTAKFTLTVNAAAGVIKENNFNTEIFVQRNKLTTIKGDVLTVGGNVEVKVENELGQLETINYADNAETLQEIINEAPVGEQTNITLGGDIVLGEGVTTLAATRAGEPTCALLIPAGKKVVLDLNGHTISHEKKCTASYEMIKNLGNLTITGNGTISFKDTSAGDPTYGWGSYTIRNEGTLVVENGTIEHLGEQDAHMICAIFQYCGHSTINGGKISTPYYRSARLWKGDMTINGGEFEGQLWLQAVDNSSDLTINGGTFAPAPHFNDASSVFVTNSTYDVKFAVNGGHFTTKIGMSVPFGCITGGTFTTAAKEATNVNILAKGYAFIEGENGDYTVVNTGHYTDENGNYYISNANGLAWVSENVNTMDFYVNQSANIFDGKTVYLTNDIDLGGAEWRPIGDYAFSRTSFNGVFDGQGYTVSNFKVTDPVQWTEKVTEASYGFFGNVKGTIKNLTIKNATINPDGGRYSAALVGRLHDGGIIENCHVVNSAVAISHWQVGGIVGQNNNGNISNCSVDGSTITGMAAVGAIVGLDMKNGEHTIENCRVTNTTLVQNESFGASYDASYGLAVGLVNASGIILNVDNFVAENNTIKGKVANTIVGDIEPGAKVTINGTQIVTTAEQLTSALKDENANSIILGADITVTENWDNRYTGAKVIRPITINGNGKTLKFTGKVDDKNYMSAFRFEAEATVINLTIDMSEVAGTGGQLRAISSKEGQLTVDNCTFIGSTNYTNTRGIIYGEGVQEATNNTIVSVTNSTFTNWKRGITDNENAKDAKNVTITNNTCTNAHVYVSAHDSIVLTGNTMNNSCVNIKTYTKATDATVVATDNTLDTNLSDYNNISGFVAANVTCQEGFNIY